MHPAYQLKIVVILTFGFALASLLGYITHRIKLSPILGYLLAGYLIGPYSPGFVADLQISEQLAEIGVILMMFGVGMHFEIRDLLRVKNIALPGAIGQTLGTTIIAVILTYFIGWPIESGILLGFAIGVASTVLLVRILTGCQLIQTKEGHIAVGWLIVEDVLTVLVLLLVPTLAASLHGEGISMANVGSSILIALFKFFLLIMLTFTIGRSIVSFSLSKIMHTDSHELFTVSVLALIFVIATGSAFLFGTSIALGAFIAGMVVRQTNLRKEVTLNSLPLKDTFVVVFFITVGTLFNPHAIKENFILFTGVLSIILIVKPVIAFLIVYFCKYPFKTGITIAFALAQIGEFSFILSEEAMKYDLIPDEGYDIIVAAALISIALNPILFRLISNETQPHHNHKLSK